MINKNRSSIGVSALIGLCLSLLLIETIPADSLTKTRMIGIERRVNEYYQKNKKLPQSLKELPIPDGKYDTTINDGWNREIIYAVNDNKIKLISYGKTGESGSPDTIKHEFVIGD
jgi:hypothetical protein